MGISGKPQELLDVGAVQRQQVPVIRRFSGGGTVVVDSGVLFATLVLQATMTYEVDLGWYYKLVLRYIAYCRLFPFNHEALPHVPPFPRNILAWTAELYRLAFHQQPGFDLREHDYVLGDHKVGGNAQSITKGRWLHHTSFLWDYQHHHMRLLAHPKRAPDYRQGRGHEAFLCRLKDHLPGPRGDVFHRICAALEANGFELEAEKLDDALELLERPHLSTTTYVDMD